MTSKAKLEAAISEVSGVALELTIRGEKAFTFSTDEYAPHIEAKIADYFGHLATVTAEHVDPATDEDGLGGSYVYVNAA